MSFSKVAGVVAVLALVLGAFQVLMGFSMVFGWGGLSRDNLSEYTTAPTTGALIDEGMSKILFAVALGTLAEIGIAVRKNNQAQ